ncbi:hydroxyisourate hydrolase [Paenibacillus hamazuiensis]|uniref:hydroxyisourate hydrolase n=1 Tax=Paenibacillus hamazuiensis TaxID=2936508 RepID=UPI00200E382D|nr:hydroxyisourate hydrolase [Paenibacillus hamazuiensis]
MSGRLTTHVLDLSAGGPAPGMRLQLLHLEKAGRRTLMREEVTGGDGRLKGPLLESEEMAAGEYELVFYVADYFRSRGVRLAEPPFLDQVPIRFVIADPTEHYHVPLLVAPGGYSTYRGS